MNDRTVGAIGRLRDLMALLRSPGGCPWDAAQTPTTLKRYLIEEAYEAVEALDRGDPPAIRDELGDLLLQIVFHARIFEERGEFDLADVAEAISEKLVRRHPHVFAGQAPGDAESLALQWDRIKAGEKRNEGAHPPGETSRALPALLRAQKVVEKACRDGLGRPSPEELIDRSIALLNHLRQALPVADAAAGERLLGEVLFTVVRMGNLLQFDAEEALRKNLDRLAAAMQEPGGQ